MANKTKFLVVIGVLIGIGAALLFVGSQSITADIIIQEGQIDETNSIRIEAMLDPEINTEGVFAVQTLEETKELILATVFDPNGVKIIETSINQNSFEEIFSLNDSLPMSYVSITRTPRAMRLVLPPEEVLWASSYRSIPFHANSPASISTRARAWRARCRCRSRTQTCARSCWRGASGSRTPTGRTPSGGPPRGSR